MDGDPRFTRRTFGESVGRAEGQSECPDNYPSACDTRRGGGRVNLFKFDLGQSKAHDGRGNFPMVQMATPDSRKPVKIENEINRFSSDTPIADIGDASRGHLRWLIQRSTVTASVTTGRALRYAEGSPRGLLHQLLGHDLGPGHE